METVSFCYQHFYGGRYKEKSMLSIQKKTGYFLIVTLCLISIALFLVLKTMLGTGQFPQIERIVLITIDTLRADHLGTYGYIRDTAPFLDQFFKGGILFKNAFVPMPTTAPSHASLFTSLYPIQHGVLKNGHKLADSFVTMAEIFREMGYKTAGFASTDTMFREGNIHQGFDYFNETTTSFELTKTSFMLLKNTEIPDKVLNNLKSLKWKNFADELSFLNAVEQQIGKEQLVHYKEVIMKYAKIEPYYRQAQLTIDAALFWLETIEPSERFFLWIHLFDPHTPLIPPKTHYEKFANLSDNDELFTFLLEQQHVEFGFFDNKKESMLEFITKYDAEIRYVDTELQRFYQYYQTNGFDTKSMWVITADHGEGLGNHNWWLHSEHLYNEQLRVPIAFHFSSEACKGKVIDTLVENIDVFPTIFKIVSRGEKQSEGIRGSSLVPFMFPRRGDTYHKNYAFSQRMALHAEKTCINELPAEHIINQKIKKCIEGENYTLQTQDYKYIYYTHGTDEFFDLQNDPYELHNIVNSGSDEERELKDTLLTQINTLKQDSPTEHLTVDEEAIEKLKSLGYVQ